MDQKESLIALIKKDVAKKEISLTVLDQVAGLVNKLMTQEDAPIRDIASTIERDPTLSARVLNLANSSAYAGLVKMKTVERAIIRVGLKSVKNFLLTGVLKDIFVGQSPVLKQAFQRWWKNSLGTAVCMKRLMEHIKKTELAEDAYLLGLLHDIGMVVILNVLNDFQKRGESGAEINEALVREMIDTFHASVGAGILRKLEFDERISRLVETHCAPEEYTDQEDVLLHALQVAIAILKKTPLALEPDPELAVMSLPSTSKLGVDPVFVAMCEVDIEDGFCSIDQALQ